MYVYWALQVEVFLLRMLAFAEKYNNHKLNNGRHMKTIIFLITLLFCTVVQGQEKLLNKYNVHIKGYVVVFNNLNIGNENSNISLMPALNASRNGWFGNIALPLEQSNNVVLNFGKVFLPNWDIQAFSNNNLKNGSSFLALNLNRALDNGNLLFLQYGKLYGGTTSPPAALNIGIVFQNPWKLLKKK